MIDNSIYTNASGSKNLLASLQVIANNLSNANTNGFHADYENYAVKNSKDNLLQTRILPSGNGIYTDLTPGPINYTGRELDIAIEGPGFISVQSKNGQAGYTRSGSFDITPQGILITNKGELVLGDGGLITIPPAGRVSIDRNGVVSVKIAGQPANTLTEIARIKLVEAKPGTLVKGEDGLFYPSGDEIPKRSTNIKIVSESLEGSNVNIMRSLTDMIQLSRQFDIHSKHLRSSEENADKANQLLNIQE